MFPFCECKDRDFRITDKRFTRFFTTFFTSCSVNKSLKKGLHVEIQCNENRLERIQGGGFAERNGRGRVRMGLR